MIVTKSRSSKEPKVKVTKSRDEDQVKSACLTYLEKRGWESFTLYTGGIPLPSGKRAPNPVKGIPDTILYHPGLGKIVWLEYKRTVGGIVSDHQQQWHDRLRAGGHTVWLVNSLDSLKHHLTTLEVPDESIT